MSEPVLPIPEPAQSEPPAAKIGRAYIDALADAAQNLGLMGIVTYAWLGAEAIDTAVAIGILCSIAGVANIGQILDRFTVKRVPRAPLTALIGIAGASKVAAMGGGVAEIVRRVSMLTLLGVLPLVMALQACAAFRTVNDHAIEFCESVMGAEAARQGITVEQLCMVPSILEPFLLAQRAATAASRAANPPLSVEP